MRRALSKALRVQPSRFTRLAQLLRPGGRRAPRYSLACLAINVYVTLLYPDESYGMAQPAAPWLPSQISGVFSPLILQRVGKCSPWATFGTLGG